MVQESRKTRDFKIRLSDSLSHERRAFPAIQLAKHQTIYGWGERAETVYFIESGQVKLTMLSPEGKECLLAIHTAGDTFGELCLTGAGIRQETAVTMEETRIQELSSASFMDHLTRNSLLEGFVHYLADRVGE